MARPKRFELLTPWFVAKYSIQLSYGRVVFEKGRNYTKIASINKAIIYKVVANPWLRSGTPPDGPLRSVFEYDAFFCKLFADTVRLSKVFGLFGSITCCD